MFVMLYLGTVFSALDYEKSYLLANLLLYFQPQYNSSLLFIFQLQTLSSKHSVQHERMITHTEILVGTILTVIVLLSFSFRVKPALLSTTL